MSKRIDHVLAALDQVTQWDMSDAEADVSLAAAQVHATLALVEQQRIANLIAWRAENPDHRSNGGVTIHRSDRAASADTQIREGLGL